MKRKAVIIALLVGISTGIFTGTVLAAAWQWQFPNSNVWAWGGNLNELIIDPQTVGVLQNEVFLFTSPALGGVASDKTGEARAEMLVKRSGGSNGNGDVWMKSSSDAKVHVAEDGDVIITLGN